MKAKKDLFPRYALIAAIAILGLLLPPGRARAAEVYLNGVKVTGLKNQALKNCAVRFDGTGNIYITAPGYTVQKVPAATGERTPAPTVASLRYKYFLVTQTSPEGSAQYDIDVFLNGKWIRKVRSSEGQVIEEVTRHLSPGKASVHFAATKNYGGQPRLSHSPDHSFKVLIGTGQAAGGTVTISTTLAAFSVTADKTHNFGQTFSFTVQ